ncbi:MAG: proprotein convertase P-domain-containing protein, partial [Deltaproteobacteria bacterium]|nr:proprotein convertase P-domain-containing protein [Deltaproteobacteria bacterium]
GAPTTPAVKSLAHGPRIDCHTADPDAPDGDATNVLRTTTLQWRMRYRHAVGGDPVTLRALATGDGGATWQPVREWADLNGDLEYAIQSYPLPGDTWKSLDVRVGFEVDTGDGSTFDLDSLRIDDVKVAAGVPNRFVKAQVLKCKPGAPDCSYSYNYDKVCDTAPKAGSTLPKCDVKPGEELPVLNMGVCDWYKLMACFVDPDASYSTWQFFGYPAGYVEGAPLDALPFILSEGCTSDVGTFCDQAPNAFLCPFEIKPGCDDALAGTYRSGIITMDEYDPKKAPHSTFETLTKFSLNVLLEDGWIVWSPNGPADPAAVAAKKAIAATGRRVQVLKDIRMVPDLTKYSGVFAALGARGRHHAVADDEAAKLAAWLQAGGSLYLEGGDFFEPSRQPPTVLHPLLKTWAKADGPGEGAKLAGPATGRNFLNGLQFTLSQGTLNNRNDLLAHSPATGARELLQVGGAIPAAIAVAYEGAASPGKTYRTIAASFSWSGLKAGSDPAVLMQRYLSFLEDGYPACAVPADCEDFDPCTADSCAGPACSNLRDPDCTECLDDLVMADGVTPSCPAGQACVAAVGLCADIVCGGVQCTLVASSAAAPAPFSAATGASVPIDVADPGAVRALHAAVRVDTPARGGVVLALVAPDGTEVVLKASDEKDTARGLHATYEAGVPLPAGQTLAAFGGAPLAGTWTLRAGTDLPFASGRLLSWTLHASVRHEDGHDCAAGAECASGWCSDGVCATPLPLKTLLFEEDCWTDWPTPYAEALARIGWTYQSAANESDFQKALAKGPWDLVIHVRYRTQAAPAVIDKVRAHVDAGGRLVLATWNPAFKHPLYAAMGIADGARFDAPLAIHVWDEAHPLFNLPYGTASVLEPVQDTCISDGARVTVGTGTAVAGFTAAPAGGQAAVVVGPTGRTIWMGEMPFLFARDRLVGFLANQLHWLATH